eukprot:2215076-Karenia_brevis.AAC.1
MGSLSAQTCKCGCPRHLGSIFIIPDTAGSKFWSVDAPRPISSPTLENGVVRGLGMYRKRTTSANLQSSMNVGHAAFLSSAHFALDAVWIPPVHCHTLGIWHR